MKGIKDFFICYKNMIIQLKRLESLKKYSRNSAEDLTKSLTKSLTLIRSFLWLYAVEWNHVERGGNE